jgi:hypothetical protein
LAVLRLDKIEIVWLLAETSAGLHPTQNSQASAYEPQAISTFDAIGEAAAAIEHTETTLQMLDGQRVWQQPHQNRRRPRSLPFGMQRTARMHSAAGKPMPQGHWG